MSIRKSMSRESNRRAAARWPSAFVSMLAAWPGSGCSEHSVATEPDTAAQEVGALQPSDAFAAERRRMVDEQIAARGISDTRVLAAMERVPRHAFVDAARRPHAYEDRPLPISARQTISQPYIVAIMTELARVDASSRVLEIGTGSGYQAAVLREVAGEVYSIEIIAELAAQSRETLHQLGYDDIHLREGDGYRGWAEAAPFDAILVTAAPPRIPQPLLDQLAEGGRLVVPVGSGFQQLEVHTRTPQGIRRETIFGVRFVPMTGRIQNPSADAQR
jgi:protein-L-isoaspartate(D-aspartate) O-methyltransferase